MIRQCEPGEFEKIYQVINDAASAYRGVIAPDCWKEPYMSREEIRHEIDDGVVFWGSYEGTESLGVMGLQHVGEVALIRHAYVRTAGQRRGIGTGLLAHLRRQTDLPMLVGTWKAATWAIRFYQKHGFRLVRPALKEQLLRRFWSVPQRQIEESVVLADERYPAANPEQSGLFETQEKKHEWKV